MERVGINNILTEQEIEYIRSPPQIELQYCDDDQMGGYLSESTQNEKEGNGYLTPRGTAQDQL